MSVRTFIAGIVAGAAFAAAPAIAAEGPFNQAQVDKGKQEYNTHCRTCHSKDGNGALGPALHGEPFKAQFGGQSVADVRNWIHENMPQTAPGSLKDEQLQPIMAYILTLNGYTPGSKELTAADGKDVMIEK